MLRNKIQPIWGAASQCTLWLSANGQDHFVKNPNFDQNAPHKTSIYCVHGTLDRDESFSVIADLLKGKLPANVDGLYLLAFDDRLQGVGTADYAKQLKNKIVMNKSNNVILMGHSRGALISAWCAEFLAFRNDIQVDLVVSICGPFRGSNKARWPATWLSQSISEMQVDSKFLIELSKKIAESETKYLFVGAEEDMLVQNDSYFPYSYDRHGISIMRLPRHGHLSMVSKPDPLMIDSMSDIIARVERDALERLRNIPGI